MSGPSMHLVQEVNVGAECNYLRGVNTDCTRINLNGHFIFSSEKLVPKTYNFRLVYI